MVGCFVCVAFLIVFGKSVCECGLVGVFVGCVCSVVCCVVLYCCLLCVVRCVRWLLVAIGLLCVACCRLLFGGGCLQRLLFLFVEC